MLFLVVSAPRPEKPSSVAAARLGFWRWMAPHLESGVALCAYGRTGRGAVAVFNVDSNETLHRLLSEWAEIIPAQFDVYPLVDVAASRKLLTQQQRAKPVVKKAPSRARR
jgi:hypothetical protein